jgi:hypothetical protein
LQCNGSIHYSKKKIFSSCSDYHHIYLFSTINIFITTHSRPRPKLPNMSTVVELLEDWSIYVILSLRGENPGFHWGIYVPTNKPQGYVWHAINESGGWKMEEKISSGVPYPMSLCLVFKVGTVNSSNWDTLRSTLYQIPAEGQPSTHTGEVFSCRTWTKDSLLALHNAGIIQLTQAIQTIESDVVSEAEQNRRSVELGRPAMVWNHTGFTTTST